MIVIVFSYIYFANFNFEQIVVNIMDQIILVAFVMYVVVFAGSFLVMLQQLSNRQKELEHYRLETEKSKKQVLELISNRRKVQISLNDILYIESLSDYIKVHTTKQTEVISKEKISVVSEKLPKQFVRIHRSFIVNVDKIIRFSPNEVELDLVQLNIGRSYKQQVLSVLKSI